MTIKQFTAYVKQQMQSEQDDDKKNVYIATEQHLRLYPRITQVDMQGWLAASATDYRARAESIREVQPLSMIVDIYETYAQVYGELRAILSGERMVQ